MNREKGPTKRFDPSWWSEKLVPVLLALLLLALLVTLVVIGLSLFGLTPSAQTNVPI